MTQMTQMRTTRIGLRPIRAGETGAEGRCSPVRASLISVSLVLSSGAVRLNMGTLYPGLMRLEQRGLIRGEWGVTDTNRKARYYAITAAGRRQLDAQRADWDRTAAMMRTLLDDQG